MPPKRFTFRRVGVYSQIGRIFTPSVRSSLAWTIWKPRPNAWQAIGEDHVEIGRPLPRDFADNADKLRAAHLLIGEAYRNHETLGTDAEWLMDNYHIIRDTLAEIRTDLPTGYYHRLPKLIEGPLAGYPPRLCLAVSSHRPLRQRPG